MQSSLSVGDQVVLTSGIYGSVVGVRGRPPGRRDRRRRHDQGRPRCRRHRRTAADLDAERHDELDDESSSTGPAARRARHGARRLEGELRMARKTARPGRTLVVFFLSVAVIYGLVAIAGTWKPALGPRPQGRHPDHPDRRGQPEQREPQRSRRDHRRPGQRLRRHRGRGDHPGQPVHHRRDPRQDRQRPRRHGQAPGSAAVPHRRLHRGSRWRRPAPARRRRRPTPRSTRARPPSAKAGDKPRVGSSPARSRRQGRQEGHGQGLRHRPEPPGLRRRRRRPRPRRPPRPTARRRPRPTPPTESGTPERHARPPPRGGEPEQALAFITSPDQASIDAFNAFTCPATKPVDDDPAKPLVTCGTEDDAATKYLLSPAVIEGTDLSSASAGVPQGEVQWVGQPHAQGRRARTSSTELSADDGRHASSSSRSSSTVRSSRRRSSPA